MVSVQKYSTSAFLSLNFADVGGEHAGLSMQLTLKESDDGLGFSRLLVSFFKCY